MHRCIEIIAFSQKRQVGVFEKIEPLFKKGLSITDIADQTGLKRTAIWRELKTNQKSLRAANPVSFDRWRKGSGKTAARPPYGFCYFQGDVIKSPTEYPTLLLIGNLRTQGLSIAAIAEKLRSKRIRSRSGKAGSYNVIKATLQRLEDGTIDKLIGGKQKTKAKGSGK